MSIILIKELFQTNETLTQNEIKEKTKFSSVYIHRILKTLVNRNFLIFDIKRLYDKKIPTKIYKLKRK